MHTRLLRQLRAGLRERGATVVEYALLAGLVAVGIATTVALIGPALVPGFQTVLNGLP